ncbi:MAG: hypothetical protein ACFFAU_04990 [Candidatus Hodarchaeota archaeon]
MIISVLRGLIISIISAIVITFMVLFFTPLLPFNPLEGLLGILVFLTITAVSFLVYAFLPSESSNSRSMSTNMQPDISNETKT